MQELYTVYLAISRWVLPALSLLLVYLWVMYFRGSRLPKTPIARFLTRDGLPLPLYVAEGIIGRRKHCDIQLPVATVSKQHAMVYQKSGAWYLAPLKGETWLNEQYLEEPALLMDGDVAAFAEQELIFECNDPEPENISSFTPPTGGLALLVLSLFQCIMGGQLCLRHAAELSWLIPAAFGGLVVAEWVYFALSRLAKRSCLLAELPILYLFTLGLAVCAGSSEAVLNKQLLCGVAGMVGCILLTLLLKAPEFCQRLRYAFALVAVAVMWFTVFFGTRINGSRNWLSFGDISFQPSEFAKVAFLLVGSASLFALTRQKTNTLFFLGFAGALMGALVLMVDFGAIAIFFVTLLVLLCMRLTDWRLLVVIAVGAVAAGGVALLLYPHIANRFAAWTNAWDYASSIGYQQTRTMIAAASGGLLGLGGSNGNLRNVAAAETDLVFGVLSEEWGGLIALCALLCFVALAIYARRLAEHTAGSFYAIAVCGAAGMMVFQTALNVFGSVDLLPLTGVTMMFVSRGGTSLMAAFLLLAFFKAAETPPHSLETERRRYY